MGRQNKSVSRPLMADAKYNSLVVSKFVCRMMLDGKKSIATGIVYDAMDKLRAKTDKEPLEVFLKALDNVKPMVEVKSRRVGGATYQAPVEVRPSRRTALAMRWLVDFARKRGEKSMDLRLAGEIMDAAEGKGAAVKKREDVHRMAEANKAFSHYRF